MRDERELIPAAIAGDRRAFEELVALKRERVVRTAYQVTGDIEDALDVAQVVFLKLWRGLPRFDPRRPFDTWLYRVTVNAAIDVLRSRGARGIVQPLPEGAEETLSGSERSSEEQIDLDRLRRVFLRLAGRLAPKQRIAFVLREIEGLETAEVARVMGVAESTVRNHLLQARRLLRSGLERDYGSWVGRPEGTGRRGGEGEER